MVEAMDMDMVEAMDMDMVEAMDMHIGWVGRVEAAAALGARRPSPM